MRIPNREANIFFHDDTVVYSKGNLALCLIKYRGYKTRPPYIYIYICMYVYVCVFVYIYD